MRPTTFAAVILCALATTTARAWSDQTRGGQVTLPLDHWTALLGRSESRAPPSPPAAVAMLSQSLDGTFSRGLFRATLALRFEVLADRGHVRLPVIGDAASISSAVLDRKPAALARERGMYTVGVDRAGVHEVTLRLLVGEEQDHFARRLKLVLPPGGSTRLSILVPEVEIDATLHNGVLTATTARGQSTLIQGCLDASGQLELAWTRRVTHRSGRGARLEARSNTLLTVDEALVRGLSVFDFTILEGETDRIDLRLPAAAEPLGVSGDAVLHWRAGGKERQLSLLLRHLVRGSVRVAVRYQLPGALSGRVSVPVILPSSTVPYSGAAAIQAPAALDVRVAAAAARPLPLRDLPTELGELTRNPLVAAFAFNQDPGLTLTATRRRQVPLTTTLVDELHAATVLVDQGSELTKLRLHIRNNTRQYLRLRLPRGATLTHSLVDGQPVRPARAGEEREGLLFPLRQSERVERGAARVHRVEAGETLGEIAHLYYSDPAKWPLILEANRQQLRDERQLRPGLRLAIPSPREVTVEESSFVLELSYRRDGRTLGLLGKQRVDLPELDVDVMRVHWHLYLPSSVIPLRFAANLTQLSAIQYDPLRRARDFLRLALSGHRAWAGEYRSILTQRKRIFEEEARRRSDNEAAPSNFPLVGERYRFTRILAAREQPAITILYTQRSLGGVARWGALLIAATLALLLLRARRWWTWLTCSACGVLLLALGHAVPGMHRRMIWGVALALAIDLWRQRRRGDAARWRALAWAPWTAGSLVTPRACALVVGLALLCWLPVHYPMFLSTTTVLVLAACRLRIRRPGRDVPSPTEASDAPQTP
jgi:nucleoid-associated protein YgaU